MDIDSIQKVVMTACRLITAECVSEWTMMMVRSIIMGVLKEIYEYSFTNDDQKKLVLFKCEWYDPGKNGTKIHRQFSLIEINERRRYPYYDPFIFAHQACQVYYTRFPEGHPGWKSVIKITPRSIVANIGVE